MTPEEIEHLIARAIPGVTEEQWAGLHQAPWLERAQRVVQALAEANLSIVGGGVKRPKPEPPTYAGEEEFQVALQEQLTKWKPLLDRLAPYDGPVSDDDPIPYILNHDGDDQV